jgi:hypothetical protein
MMTTGKRLDRGKLRWFPFGALARVVPSMCGTFHRRSVCLHVVLARRAEEETSNGRNAAL